MTKPLPLSIIRPLVRSALAEDRVDHDITSRLLIDPRRQSRAGIVFKSGGIACGLDFARETFRQVDSRIKVKTLLKDGSSIKAGLTAVELIGPQIGLLKAERTALNFLGYLSGIATKTYAFVQAVKPYKAAVLDTRKTTPLMRDIEKYAVRCGGGDNHRRDLSEMILIKDNHLIACAGDSLADIIRSLRKRTGKIIEIEVDSLNQLKDAMEGRPEMILLDNMNPAQLRHAVQIVRSRFGRGAPLLEASGGVTLKNIRSIASTGVDRISVGALTHSRTSLDVSLEFFP